MLLDAFGRLWPDGLRAKFVVTPGGFVQAGWPPSWRGRAGWGSRGVDLQPLLLEAEELLRGVVTPRVLRAARGKTDVLTIGVDVLSEGHAEHAELVAIFNVEKQALVRWTGKSYPTAGQEHTLVHVVDLDSHLLEIAGERALILGCQDLNMYSPRGRANQSPTGPRRARCDEMKRCVARFRPTVVLQHPHSTDTPNIWRTPWLSLVREVPSATAWASGIEYFNWNGRPRAGLTDVLERTRSSGRDVHDLLVEAGTYA
jgi:hypothetical protein